MAEKFVFSISLYRNPEKIPQNEQIIVQEYIDKPFLVDGYKCDMRIYVLVTSCDPLRIFLYNDGLLRMGTEHYVHPSDHNIVSYPFPVLCSHLSGIIFLVFLYILSVYSKTSCYLAINNHFNFSHSDDVILISSQSQIIVLILVWH